VPDLSGESARKASLFKTFLIGLVLGVAMAAGMLYAFPVVDQAREASIVRVAPNGGTLEAFHINIPMDRVMAGTQAGGSPVPVGLEWPTDPRFADVRTEMFKIRDARDSVVGVGVRTAARHGDEDVIDWLLHLPARGSLFISMDPVPREGGARIGNLVSGTREFADLSGSLGERWVASESDEEDEPTGRIELRASYIGELEPLPVEEGAE
jgi:hypothetical protein